MARNRKKPKSNETGVDLFPKDLGFTRTQLEIRRVALDEKAELNAENIVARNQLRRWADSRFRNTIARHTSGKCAPDCRLCREAGLK